MRSKACAQTAHTGLVYVYRDLYVRQNAKM